MGDADEEQRLAQQVYLVIKADVDKDGKNSNSQVLGVYFTGARGPRPAPREQRLVGPARSLASAVAPAPAGGPWPPGPRKTYAWARRLGRLRGGTPSPPSVVMALWASARVLRFSRAWPRPPDETAVVLPLLRR